MHKCTLAAPVGKWYTQINVERISNRRQIRIKVGEIELRKTYIGWEGKYVCKPLTINYFFVFVFLENAVGNMVRRGEL